MEEKRKEEQQFMEEKKEKLTIFDEQVARKPDRYPWAQQFKEAMHNGFWTDKEFNFQSDLHDFNVLMTPQEQEIIKKTLSAIGQIEISVKKFWAKLGDNLPHPSLTDLGYVMANTEVIHNDAYERLLSVLGMDDIFEENMKLDIIKGRVNYLRKYLHKFHKDSKKQYVYALILFTLFVENVSLFSQFYIIRWFGRNKNILKDTNQQVKYTRLEEQIHAQVGMKIVNTIREELPELFDDELEEKILHEASESFICESKIIEWMLGDFNEEGLNVTVLKEFIKNQINNSLKGIKFKKLFTINRELKDQFNWANEELLGNNSTDFFWQRPVEYSRKDKTFDTSVLFPDKIYKKTW